jgi:hypothetical protein
MNPDNCIACGVRRPHKDRFCSICWYDLPDATYRKALEEKPCRETRRRACGFLKTRRASVKVFGGGRRSG